MSWSSNTADTRDGAQPALPDPEQLRRQIAAAGTEEERDRLEHALGRACGGLGQIPLAQDSPRVWTGAVCHAVDKPSAELWLAQVEGDTWLALVATHGRYAEVRLAAARRLKEISALRQVAEASREKDKLVFRHCTDALRAHRDSGERARRAPELALALETLLEAQPIALSHLLEIEKEINSIGADTAELSECAALLRRAHARVIEETQAQIDVRTRLLAAQSLAADIAGAVPPAAEQEAAWRRLHNDLAESAAPQPAWLARLPVAKECEKTLQEIASRLDALRAAPPAPPAPDLPVPEAPPVEKPAAQPPPPPRKKIDTAALQLALAELDQHLENGRLADADAAASRMDQTLAGLTLTGPLAGRLQRSRARLTELRGWARWGTDQARDKLIAEAEALVAGNPDVEQRAVAVPAMRNEWKRLDAGGAAKKALWERFDALMEKAYAPVAEKRAADALRHKAARSAKAALCEGLEAWLAQYASGAADLKALAAKRDAVMIEWRSAGMAGFGDERKLRKRLDALLERIDAPLQEARTLELARRKELVIAAEALRDAPDVGQGISAAKTLQARWKAETLPVPLRHGGEQKLWQRFRAACDAVFARRDAERAGQIAEREERGQAQKATLDEFAANLLLEDAGKLQAALAAFRTAQGAEKPAVVTSEPDPRTERGGRAGMESRGRPGMESRGRTGMESRGRTGMESRGRDSGIGTRGRGPVKVEPREPVVSGPPPDARVLDLIRRAEQRIEALHQAKRDGRFALMAKKAALAETLEAAAAAAAPVEEIAARASEEWESMERLPGDAEKLLLARLQAAATASTAALANGREARDALLLDLEIALELESPAPHADARRARTLSRLQNRFRGADAATEDPEAMVVQWYALAAVPDAAQAARMEAIVRRLIERLREPKPQAPVQTFAAPRRERSERRDERPGRRR